jgi:glycosyltransferase involved in cell wall biosynthesis
MLLTSLDEVSLKELFRPEDVRVRYRPPVTYATRERWMSRFRGWPLIGRRLCAWLFSLVEWSLNGPVTALAILRASRLDPDIVHQNNGDLGRWVATILRRPLVLHLHGTAKTSWRGQRWIAPPTLRLIAVSNFVAEFVRKDRCDTLPVEVILNPTPAAAGDENARAYWRRRLGLPDEAVLVTHAGRLVRWKGQKEFLQAFAHVTAANPTAHAIIAGDDTEAVNSDYVLQLNTLAASAELRGRVHFVGHISPLHSLLLASDIFIHSSTEPEPFGLVITEAMSSGAAVIAARSGGPMEIVEDGCTGRLVDVANSELFSRVLEELIRNDALRDSLSKRARIVAQQRFSTEAFARRFEQSYQDLLLHSPR